jgi:hypothetical protein
VDLTVTLLHDDGRPAVIDTLTPIQRQEAIGLVLAVLKQVEDEPLPPTEPRDKTVWRLREKF